MGIQYYALNPKTKKAYDLGKGPWLRLCLDVNEYDVGIIDCSDRASLVCRITNDVMFAPQDVQYHAEIADALVRLGGKLELRSDSSWDNPVAGYEVVGSRFD